MIPIKYNVRSLLVRRTSTLMTVVSIAFVVLVYIGVLALGAGLRVAFGSSGDSSTVIVLRDGSNTEMESYFPTETYRILASLPGVARGPDGEPLASGETVTLQILERLDGSETNAIIRGVEPEAFALRPDIQLADGRLFEPGRTEIIVGEQLAGQIEGLELGNTLDLGRFTFTIVGIFDAAGSSYGSEIWGNVQEFGDAFRRQNYYSSTRLRADSPAAVEALIDAAEGNQQIDVDARSVTRHEDHRVLLMAIGLGITLAEENEQLAARIARTGDPPLVPVDDVVVAVPRDRCGDVGGVRRGNRRLRHRKGRADLAREKRLEPSFPLLVAAVANEHLHVSRVGCRAVKDFRRHRRASHELGEGRVFEVREAGAELAIGQEEVPQPLGPSFLLQLLDNRRGLPPIALGNLRSENRLVWINVLLHERVDAFVKRPRAVRCLEEHAFLYHLLEAQRAHPPAERRLLERSLFWRGDRNEDAMSVGGVEVVCGLRRDRTTGPTRLRAQHRSSL